ncbi:uncharacterized protein LOC120097883 [Rattus norvegicus]|uniref:uncharacterized protein LOC120097883 n=1 Tax=Rattus norvegicus TaxID=10116 RepID=UPI0019176A33|nr:uncharacterized protein LOC120097883 [Rattus norvegicus]
MREGEPRNRKLLERKMRRPRRRWDPATPGVQAPFPAAPYSRSPSSWLVFPLGGWEPVPAGFCGSGRGLGGSWGPSCHLYLPCRAAVCRAQLGATVPVSAWPALSFPPNPILAGAKKGPGRLASSLFRGASGPRHSKPENPEARAPRRPRSTLWTRPGPRASSRAGGKDSCWRGEGDRSLRTTARATHDHRIARGSSVGSVLTLRLKENFFRLFVLLS